MFVLSRKCLETQQREAADKLEEARFVRYPLLQFRVMQCWGVWSFRDTRTNIVWFWGGNVSMTLENRILQSNVSTPLLTIDGPMLFLFCIVCILKYILRRKLDWEIRPRSSENTRSSLNSFVKCLAFCHNHSKILQQYLKSWKIFLQWGTDSIFYP